MKIIDVLYEKCADCGNDIRDDNELGIKIHERYFCKGCVIKCHNCGKNIPKIFINKFYNRNKINFICNKCLSKKTK